MLLNNLELVTYDHYNQEVYFTLGFDTTFADVNDLDGQTLTVYDDDGQVRAEFGGYYLMGVERTGVLKRAHFMKEIEPNTKQALDAIETNQAVNASDIKAAMDLVEANAAAIEEIIPMLLGA